MLYIRLKYIKLQLIYTKDKAKMEVLIPKLHSRNAFTYARSCDSICMDWDGWIQVIEAAEVCT